MSISKKRVLSIVLAISLIAGITAAAQKKSEGIKAEYSSSENAVNLEILSSRHTCVEKEEQTVAQRFTTEGFEKKAENSVLEFWFDENNGALRVLDKRSGYIWGSTDDRIGELISDRERQDFASAVCSFEYFTNCDRGNIKSNYAGIQTDGVKTVYSFKGNKLICSVNADRISRKKVGIKFEFSVQLNEDSITFKLNDKSIKEKYPEKVRLKNIYFAPFMGSVIEDEIPGYVLIPDGSGALMRFAKKFQYKTKFEKKIWGEDVAVDKVSEQNDLKSTRPNDYIVPTKQLSMPLFGIVHGSRQNGMLSVCESGMEYATVTASPAGFENLNYNWAAVCYKYRQEYFFEVSQNGDSILTVPTEKNTVNPQQTFYFLTGDKADYSGMAVFYRNLLQNKGVIKLNKPHSHIPLHINFVGADVKDGFFYDTTEVMTTFDEASKISEDIKNNLGISNQTVVFEGWKNDGLNRGAINGNSVEGKLGSKSDLSDLKKKIEKNGGTFYLSVNPVTGNKDQMNVSQMASIGISKQLNVYETSNQNLMYWQQYIARPRAIGKYIDKLDSDFNGFSFALLDMGSRLYSDYTRGSEITRAETRKIFEKSFKSLGKRKIAANAINQYAYEYIDDCFDTPVVNSQYMFETDTVPFLQTVLKGSINCYAPYANQGFYSQNSILKMIEYGTYPSFILMNSDNESLRDTPIEHYFSVSYEDWKDTISNVYGKVSEALDKVEGYQITEHKQLADGVAKVSYSNGADIYVNYSKNDYKDGNITVKAFDYCVEGVK